ncbi:hypothetical protein, partial [Shigella flexneri]|uniref:hypothetical protein n=1 Tax=Shigella flexneri TaxID=623 RepID=UPI003CF64383
DGNGSHASTLKSPSYTKSVSWQHYQDSVPLLGDIPWFGQLFRHDGKEDERRELVVFITPRLVSSE